MQSKFLPISIANTPVASSANDAVQFIQDEITPVINWATNWGINAGFLMLGIVLFYQVVIILVKPSK